MGIGEFQLIQRWFQRPPRHPEVRLGVGDDGALIDPPPDGGQWAVSSDMLVSGVHFFPDVDPEALGHKALAVNLSDLAAMGAEPRWFTLALALPEADPDWLEAFACGLWTLAEAAAIDLVGGDVSRAPQVVASLTVAGRVPAGEALTRAGARPGDAIYCSGHLGGAAWALRRLRRGEAVTPALRRALERPQPRLALGRGLRGLASAAIDCSDGLAADLGHLLRASGVGACLELGALPLHPDVAALPPAQAWTLALAGGDDYELIFTAPPARAEAVAALARTLDLPVTRIGRVTATPGLRLQRPDGRPWALSEAGHVHF